MFTLLTGRKTTRRAPLLKTAGVALFVLAPGCTEPELNCADVRYEVCDIRDELCQSRVFNQMRCLRGDVGDKERPPVTMITPKQAEQVLIDTPPEGEETPWEIVLAERALTLIGMIEVQEVGRTTESQGQRIIEGILGFYSSETKEIAVLDVPEAEWGSVETINTLGHEYIHALQDQDFGVAQYQLQNSIDFDTSLGSRSFVEGEATLYEAFQLGRLLGAEVRSVEIAPILEDLSDAADQLAGEMASPLFSAHLFFPYTYGAHRVALAWDDAERGAVTRLRKQAPLYSQQFLAARHGATLAEPILDDPMDEADGFVSLGAERLGAWLTHTFLARTLGVSRERPTLALDWRGDVLSAFADEGLEHSGLVWRIHWRSASAAEEFVEHVNTLFPPVVGAWSATWKDDESVLIAYTGEQKDFLKLAAAAGVDRPEELVVRQTEPPEPVDAGALSDAGRVEDHRSDAGGVTDRAAESLPLAADAGDVLARRSFLGAALKNALVRTHRTCIH